VCCQLWAENDGISSHDTLSGAALNHFMSSIWIQWVISWHTTCSWWPIAICVNPCRVLDWCGQKFGSVLPTL
jgi:hypothetical protein